MDTDHDHRSVLPSLEDASSQIRLLRILPMQQDDAEELIRCTLGVHNHTDVDHTRNRDHSTLASKYVAISYTWGEPTPLKTIMVNNRPIQVRWNCWHALCQMRLHNTDVRYWIDSVCIDQDSIEEKRQQIALMASIYLGATKVAICLGPRAAADEVLFRSDLAKTDVAYRRAFETLMMRPYFTRLWPVQERSLPSPGNIQAFCGDNLVEWTTLKDLRDRLWPGQGIYRYCFEHIVPPLPIGAAISRFAHFECEDPRDKIFGLLAFVESGDVHRIAPSAGKPYLEVLVAFWSITGACMLNHILGAFISSPKSDGKSRFEEDMLHFLRWHWTEFHPDVEVSLGDQYCQCRRRSGSSVESPEEWALRHCTYEQMTVCRTISDSVLEAILRETTPTKHFSKRAVEDHCAFILQDPELKRFAEAVISKRKERAYW